MLELALHRLAICFLATSFLALVAAMAIARSHSIQATTQIIGNLPMKLPIFFLLISFCFPITVYGYSQDPRSCADPRTQYPSNPPCLTVRNDL